ncbi:ADP-ribose glycohydrolase OARD1-like [Rhopalosiphum padi]|uniref:ADP-ribose glycohydrolase OARD1-like n=1 Tax=Rhopalosiphum padi TaxID=40932 RepID=UPI00298E173B|nr:ADP-ribose glycohydrolase OARD1-like [Rhopalosiphum padi]
MDTENVEDFLISRGIAVLFKLKYGQIGLLLDQKVRVGGIAELKVNQGKDIYVFYLLTKVLYHHKPALQCLANALIQLRNRLADLCINLLIIPKLGCALDGLNWYEVRGMLHSTFVDRNVQIIVCDPENLQITRHVIATCAEKNIEFLECGGPETVKILPVELSNASENAIFTKCLNHFQLLPR